MHYFQFNIGDYASATAHLEPLEDLIYRRLLDLYYSTEKPIYDDLNKLSRIIRMRTHSELITSVLNEFFVLEGDGWHCDRVDVEIFKYTEKSAKASKSAKVRWKKVKQKQKDKGVSERNANALKAQSEGNANHKPLTINHKPLTNNHKPLTKEVTKDIVAKAPKFNFKNELLALGVNSEVLDDWLIVRKNKKASNTKTAFKGLITEITKSGLMVNDAIEYAASKSWAGFKAQWYLNEQGNNQTKTGKTSGNLSACEDFING